VVRNAESMVNGVRLASWFIPGVGALAGLSVNWLASSWERARVGSSNVFWGGLGDASGFSSLSKGVSDGDWGEMGLGALEMLGSLAGVKSLGVGIAQAAMAAPRLTMMVAGAGLVGYAGDAEGASPLSQLRQIVRHAQKVLPRAAGANVQRVRNGLAGELRQLRLLMNNPLERVIAGPGAVGVHGADLVTFNTKLQRVRLWDSKFRYLKRSVAESTTFATSGPGLKNLKNAVAQAEAIIANGAMSPMLTAAERLAARKSLALGGTGFDAITVGTGRARNSIFPGKGIVRWW